jgi:hypothetical protein
MATELTKNHPRIANKSGSDTTFVTGTTGTTNELAKWNADGDLITTGATIDNNTDLGTSNTSIPTQNAVKTYVDTRPGAIVQQFYYRVDSVERYDAELIGTTDDRETTVASTTGAKLINMQGLDFSRDGGSSENMYAGEVSDLRISITPKYADSLIVIEMNISCEPYRANSGLWMGELNTSSDKIQLITRTGYEGYNPKAPTGRNNFYSSGWYDGNTESTMKSIPLTYIDKPNTTSEKTYSPIFGSAYSDAFLVLNRTKNSSTNYQYEYGVSTISIKEIRQ